MSAKKDEFIAELRTYFFPNGKFQHFWQEPDHRQRVFSIFERAYQETHEAGEEMPSGQEIFDTLSEDLSSDEDQELLSRACDSWRDWVFAWQKRDAHVT